MRRIKGSNDTEIPNEMIIEYFYKKRGQNDIKPTNFARLKVIFGKCHDIIWSGGKMDPSMAFDEMSKLLFTKIYDERNTEVTRPYRFQIGSHEDELVVAQRIREIYNEAINSEPDIFTEEIKINDKKIYDVVKLLESISLIETDIDSKGQAFETFLGAIFRGKLGQYFTRRQVVEFVVGLLKPTEQDLIIDPSCGSGGFLLYSLKEINQKISNNFSRDKDSTTYKASDFIENNLFGIEINNKIARVAIMNMIVNDSRSNIEINTGLNSVFANPNINFGSFTLILTNPPFGVKIKSTDKDNLGQNTFSNFELSRGRSSQLSDILFLEQYHRFLTNDESKNPRIGVVLQVGVLNNPSNKRIIKWLKKNFKILAVVSLPEFAFRKAGSGMKTVVLFLKKYPAPYLKINDIPDYKVFFAIAEHIGYDSTLRPDINELPIILRKYENKENGERALWVNFTKLDYRLDPKYYFNRAKIEEKMSKMRNKGIIVRKLSEIAKDLSSGKSPIGGVTRSTGTIVSITVTNITKEGTFDFTCSVSYVPKSFYDSFIASKGELKIGDILIAKDGATTGKTAIINDNLPFIEIVGNETVIKAIFSEHVFRLRVKPEINPFYINAFLNSELGQLQLETITSGGAQGGITKEFSEHVKIPIPNRQMQDKIANIWNEGLIEIQKLRKKIVNKKQEIKDKVISSILQAVE